MTHFTTDANKFSIYYDGTIPAESFPTDFARTSITEVVVFFLSPSTSQEVLDRLLIYICDIFLKNNQLKILTVGLTSSMSVASTDEVDYLIEYVSSTIARSICFQICCEQIPCDTTFYASLVEEYPQHGIFVQSSQPIHVGAPDPSTVGFNGSLPDYGFLRSNVDDSSAALERKFFATFVAIEMRLAVIEGILVQRSLAQTTTKTLEPATKESYISTVASVSRPKRKSTKKRTREKGNKEDSESNKKPREDSVSNIALNKIT